MSSTDNQRTLANSLETIENLIYVAMVTRDPEQVELTCPVFSSSDNRSFSV